MTFEEDIKMKLTEKGLSDSSVKLYMTILKNMNDKKEIKNLKFLAKPKVILEKIKDYKPSTQRNMIICIVSTLKMLNSTLYEQYYDIMIDLTKKLNETPKSEKSEAQKDNWLEWKDVEAKFNELKSNLKISKNTTEPQFDNLLNVVILSLYVLIQPRRNQDYLNMFITNENTEDKTKNYLDLKKEQFIFNDYKTAKKYGQQIIDIPKDLMTILKLYVKNHPNKALLKKEQVPFLVHFDGKPLKSINSITRILNKIFNKKIGSSMLRHIFLTSKYGKVIDEQKVDADAMGHSIQTQKEYVKN